MSDDKTVEVKIKATSDELDKGFDDAESKVSDAGERITAALNRVSSAITEMQNRLMNGFQVKVKDSDIEQFNGELKRMEDNSEAAAGATDRLALKVAEMNEMLAAGRVALELYNDELELSNNLKDYGAGHHTPSENHQSANSNPRDNASNNLSEISKEADKLKHKLVEINELLNSKELKDKLVKIKVDIDTSNLSTGLEGIKTRIRDAMAEIQDRYKSGFDLRLEPDKEETAINAVKQGEKVFIETRTAAEMLAHTQADLNGLLQAGAIDAETHARAMAKAKDEYENAGRSANHFGGVMENVKSTLVSMAAILAIGGTLKLGEVLLEESDKATLLDVRLKELLGTEKEVAEVKDQVYQASLRQQVSSEQVADVTARMIPLMKEFGKTSADAVKLSEAAFATARISGSSPDEAAKKAHKLAEALEDTTSKGKNLESVFKENQELLSVLANYFGASTQQVEAWAKNGQISSQKMTDAILSSSDQIEAKAAEIPDTFGGAWAKVKDVLSKAVEDMSGQKLFAGLKEDVAGAEQELEKLEKDGTLAHWGEQILTIIRDVEAAFKAIGGIVSDVFSAITGDISKATGTQINALNILDGALKGIATAFIGLRVGIQIALELIKAVVQSVVASVLIEWSYFREGILIVVEVGKTAIQGLANAFTMLANVASHALQFDFSGAESALTSGLSKMEQNVKDSADRMKKIHDDAKSDRQAAAGISGFVNGDFSKNVSKIAQSGNDALKKLWHPPMTPNKGSDNNPSDIPTGHGSPDPAKEKKGHQAKSQMHDLELGLDSQKNAWEAQNNANNTEKEFPKDQEAQYWADLLANHKLSANDRIAVEKKYQDALAALRKESEGKQLDALKFEQQQFSNNLDIQLNFAKQIQAETSRYYGESSKEAQKARQDVEALQARIGARDYGYAQKNIEHDKTSDLSDIDLEEQEAQQRQQLGEMSQRKLLAMEIQFENQRYQVQKEAIQKRLALWDQYNKETGGNANPEDRMKAMDDQQTLDTSHTKTMGQIGFDQKALSLQPFQNFRDGMQSLWQKGLQSMMQGTLTWRSAIQGVYGALGNAFSQMLSKQLAEWSMHLAMKLAKALGYGVLDVTQTQSTEAAKSGAVAAGQALQTEAAAAGATIRGTTETAEALGTIAKSAPAAEAKTMASVPFPYNIAAGAGVFALIMGLSSKVASASGGYDIPAGINPLTQLHEQEMVLPAKYANVIRDMAAGGGSGQSGSSGDTHFHTHVTAVDARSVQKLFMDHRSSLHDAMKASIRDFKI